MAIFTKSVNLPVSTPAIANSTIGSYVNANTGRLNLNGNYVEFDGTVNFIKKGYSSDITISSASDISAITFSIYGINNGFYTTETLSGPNGNTVASVGLYEKIISISINNNINNAFTIGSDRDVAVLINFLNNGFSNIKPEFSCSIISPVGYAVGPNLEGIIGIQSMDNYMIYRSYNGVDIFTATTKPASFKLLESSTITIGGIQQGIVYNSNSTTNSTMTSRILFISTAASITQPTNFTCIWTN